MAQKFIFLLLSLQGVICYWSWAILKILYKVVQGAPADDTRSDSEEEETTTKQAMPEVEAKLSNGNGLHSTHTQSLSALSHRRSVSQAN